MSSAALHQQGRRMAGFVTKIPARAFRVSISLFIGALQAAGASVLFQGFVFGFNIDSMMHFLWRLSSRYVENTPGEQSAFRMNILIGFLVIWAIIMLVHSLNHYSSRRAAQ